MAEIRRIFCPIDFSEFSARAWKTGSSPNASTAPRGPLGIMSFTRSLASTFRAFLCQRRFSSDVSR